MEYYSGIKVVPIVLMANLFLGIYYTLSLWYKLTDKTRFGAYFALVGAVISISINIIFIPVFGYMASAVAVLLCFIVMTILSYRTGQKYFKVDYPLKRILFYLLLAVVIYLISKIINLGSLHGMYFYNAALLLIFALVVYYLENKELRKFIH